MLDGLIKAAVRFDEMTTLIHGSTVVVNAVIERQGAKTALVTTKGFRDVYEIGRINRPESFNPRFRKHRPLVAREDIFEVTERMLADGSVRTPFDEQEARAVARIIKDEGFAAVAVLFLHSYRAPEHEIRMREILLETEPNLFVSVSHELSREYREYERTSTVAANAYVGPKVSQYLGDLERRLKQNKFAGNLMIMQSNGGLSDVEMARRQCIQMMESGPAGGVVGTMALCETLDLAAAIAFDMGGTTAKACVIRRGEPSLSPDYFIGGYNEGLAIRIPVLDIVEVGTGGGSIAFLDEGGGSACRSEERRRRAGTGKLWPRRQRADGDRRQRDSRPVIAGKLSWRRDASRSRRGGSGVERKTCPAAQRHAGARRRRHVASGDFGDGQRGASCDIGARSRSARFHTGCLRRRRAAAFGFGCQGIVHQQDHHSPSAGSFLSSRHAHGGFAPRLCPDAVRALG